MLTGLKKHRNVIFFAILALLLLMIHHEVIVADPISQRDDASLLDPLRGIKSFSQYWTSLIQGKFRDLQPIRDLSFYMDFKLSSLLNNRGVHHFMNVFYFFIFLMVVFNFFLTIGISWSATSVFILAIAIHPALASAVAWISSRKHILSGIFIILASQSHWRLKDSEKAYRIPLYYLISLLAQPISLLWPVWAWITSKFCLKRNKIEKHLLICFILLITVFFINFNFYHYPGETKKLITILSTFPLALGRFFIQIIYPFHIAAHYYKGNTLNFIGIPFFVLYFFFLSKFIPLKQAIIWFIFYIYSLLVVYNKFVYDTYLIIPTTALFISLALILKHNKKFHIPFITIFIIASPWMLIKSKQVSHMWLNDLILWKTSYETEQGPYSGIQYAQLIINDNPEKSLEIITSVINRYSMQNPAIPTIIAKALYLSKKISFPEKIKLFNQYKFDDLWFRYFLAHTYLSHGYVEEAFNAIKNDLLSIDPDEKRQSNFYNEWKKICMHYKSKACMEIFKK